MARKQTQTADSLPLVAIDLGSDSVRAMAARQLAPDLFQILGVEERPQKFGNICVEQGIITQSSNAGFVIAEVKKSFGRKKKPTILTISAAGHIGIEDMIGEIEKQMLALDEK